MSPEETNIAVAERLGWTFKDEGWRYPDQEDWQKYKAVYRGDGFVGLQKPGWSQIPNFHGSVDAAMALVAKAREWGWDFQCGSNATGFYCLFDTAHTEECVDAPTLPAAIALCFLKLPVPTP